MKKLIFSIIVLCSSQAAFAGTVIPFGFRCHKVFRPYMSEFPSSWLRWENESKVTDGIYQGLRQYDGVYYNRYGGNVFIETVLPPIVKNTLAKKMSFNSFTAVMNFYFPGFGLKNLDASNGSFFHSLVGTTFRVLDHKGGEQLKGGDLIIIRNGDRIEQAMVFLGNNITWQKPSTDLPAGFYNFADVTLAFIKAMTSKNFSAEYYRLDLGSSTDYYSQRVFSDIQKGNTDHYFDSQGF